MELARFANNFFSMRKFWKQVSLLSEKQFHVSRKGYSTKPLLSEKNSTSVNVFQMIYDLRKRFADVILVKVDLVTYWPCNAQSKNLHIIREPPIVRTLFCLQAATIHSYCFRHTWIRLTHSLSTFIHFLIEIFLAQVRHGNRCNAMVLMAISIKGTIVE